MLGKKPYWVFVVRVANVLNSSLPKVLLKEFFEIFTVENDMYKTEEGYCPISCCVTNNALYFSTLYTTKVVDSYFFFRFIKVSRSRNKIVEPQMTTVQDRKTNSFVHFLGESAALQFCFEIY